MISKKLAELMGGTMTVESEAPGLGSTFRLSISAPAAALAPQAADWVTKPICVDALAAALLGTVPQPMG